MDTTVEYEDRHGFIQWSESGDSGDLDDMVATCLKRGGAQPTVLSPGQIATFLWDNRHAYRGQDVNSFLLADGSSLSLRVTV